MATTCRAAAAAPLRARIVVMPLGTIAPPSRCAPPTPHASSEPRPPWRARSRSSPRPMTRRRSASRLPFEIQRTRRSARAARRPALAAGILERHGCCYSLRSFRVAVERCQLAAARRTRGERSAPGVLSRESQDTRTRTHHTTSALGNSGDASMVLPPSASSLRRRETPFPSDTLEGPRCTATVRLRRFESSEARSADHRRLRSGPPAPAL